VQRLREVQVNVDAHFDQTLRVAARPANALVDKGHIRRPASRHSCTRIAGTGAIMPPFSSTGDSTGERRPEAWRVVLLAELDFQPRDQERPDVAPGYPCGNKESARSAHRLREQQMDVGEGGGCSASSARRDAVAGSAFAAAGPKTSSVVDVSA
jgi:hypothetical protein